MSRLSDLCDRLPFADSFEEANHIDAKLNAERGWA